jgi:hypothetical protein
VKEKVYLGDAVYAKIDDFGDLVLTVEYGLGAVETVILEPGVVNNLLEFLGAKK